MKGKHEWTNHGDINFTEYGGTMVRPDAERNDDYEFFMLTVMDDGKRYAFHGTICCLPDYAGEKCLADAAAESGQYADAAELIEKNPEYAVCELLTSYGYGPIEFSASNIYGQGEYSTYYRDFEVKSMDDLVKYMNGIDIPAQYIPDHTFVVTSRYGEAGIEDELKTFDWEKVKAFAHDKLMSGFPVTVKDTRDGSEASLDPGEYAEKFNGEFPIDPERRLEADYRENDEEEVL